MGSQVFISFPCILRSITTVCPPFKQAKSMKTFNIYLIKSVANFKIFSLKRFFSPTRAPAGPPQNLIYPLTFRARPVDKSVKGGNYDKKKVLLHRLPPRATTKKNLS